MVAAAAEDIGLVHGFRVDPMLFVQQDTSLQASLVRSVVFGRSSREDESRIEARFAEIFSRQNPDGSMEDKHGQGQLAATGEALTSLLEMGCSPDRPEMARAIAAIQSALENLRGKEEEEINCYALRALCDLGLTEHPVVAKSLLRMAENMPDLLGGGCPWTPFVQLNALWAGREVADVDGAIKETLLWAEGAVEASGCSKRLGLCVPWSIVQMVGVVDHPAAERIARKILPLLLRMQKPDGGWGEKESNATLRAFVVLKKYGFLEKLRALPPLPPDWQVVKTLEAPGEKPKNIAWSGGALWVLDVDPWAISALSPMDGQVLAKLLISPKPGTNHFGFGVGDGVFYLSAFGEKGARMDIVYEIDKKTGTAGAEMIMPTVRRATGNARVGDSLFVADGWNGGVWVVDLVRSDHEPERISLAASMPDYLAGWGDEIWGVDWFSPVMVKTNAKGDLLDWAEQPFGFNPVAHDGEHLWVLEAEEKKIHQIERLP